MYSLVDRGRANVSQFDKSFLRLEIKTRNRKKKNFGIGREFERRSETLTLTDQLKSVQSCLG